MAPNRLLPLLLFAATVCFTLGISQPLLRVERLFVFSDEPSLIAIIVGLWTEGDMALSALIALFSAFLPAVKLVLLHLATFDRHYGTIGIGAWLFALSRWSMLDVLLVALVVFAAKTSGLATAFTLPGLWFFAASVLLTAVASALLRRH